MTTPPSPPSSAPDRPRLPWDPPEHFEKRIPDGDNRERLVCARCEFIHYQNPKIVAGAVCTWGDRILLAKRAIEPRKGFWTVPAGYMELGETTEQAAEREAREEACASIEIERLLAMYSVARIGQVQIMYRARLLSADVAAGVESEEVALVAWDDIPVGAARLSDRRVGARPLPRVARQDRIFRPTPIPRAISPACGRRASRRESKKRSSAPRLRGAMSSQRDREGS